MAGAPASASDSEFSDSDVEFGADSEEEAVVDEEKLQELREAISANPHQYDVHVALINMLRGAERIDEVRAAREAMHQALPMSEDLWLSWLEDEIRTAVSPEEKAAVHRLWEEATKDFLAVNIWKAYGSYALEEFAYRDETQPLSEAVEAVRGVLAKAVSAVGYHIPRSQEVWDLLRQFEEDSMEADRSDAQLSRVVSLYSNRLKIPHKGIEETFSQFSSFITRYDNANYEKQMVAAKKLFNVGTEKYQERESYEQALIDAQESYEEFCRYISFETAPKKPDTLAARTLFERALAVHFSVPDLWLEYISFMEKHINIMSNILPVCSRAVRNCPWSGDLWSQYIHLLDRADNWIETAEEVSQRALDNPFIQSNVEELIKVWNAKVDLVRWRFSNGSAGADALRSVLQTALDSVKQLGDPYHRLELRRINTEIYVLGDIDQARQLWKSLVRTHPTESDLTVQCAEFERQHSNVQAALSLLRSASQRNLDWPERVFSVWLAMEQDHGTPGSLQICLTATRQQRKRHAAKAELQALQAQYVQEAPPSTPAAGPAARKAKPRGGSASAQGNRRERRRQARTEAEDIAPDSASGDGIVKREGENGSKQETKRKSISWAENTVIEDDSRAKRPRPGTKNVNKAASAFMLTVSLKNVDPLVTEKQIREFFADVGRVRNIRFPANATANESCQVFVEFGTKYEAFAALKKNNETLGSRVVQVESGRDEGDMRTAYVCNFPEGYCEKELTELFKDFGTIERVRLPATGSHHKRFAYVQFAEEHEAQAACQLDGMNLGAQWNLFVAISNPSLKKARKAPPGADPQALFFSGLSFSTTEGELKALCEKHGTVENVRLLSRADGTPRGLAIVRFADGEAAKAALLAEDGTTLHGRKVGVAVYDPAAAVGKQQAAKTKSAPKKGAAKSAHQAANAPSRRSAKPQGEGERDLTPKTNQDFRKMLGI